MVWVDRDSLFANQYNPNKVAKREFELLRESIRQDGWALPIVVRPSGEIVDGFHRWTLSGEPEFRKMTDGKIPVVYLDDVDTAHQMESTIRYNRARGKHGVVQMAEIVNDLIGQGQTEKEISATLGMELEEIRRLRKFGLMTDSATGEFGKAWIPSK